MLATASNIFKFRGYVYNVFLNNVIFDISVRRSYYSRNRGYVRYLITGLYANNRQFDKIILKGRLFSNESNFTNRELDSVEYEKLANETLEAFSDYFDELVDDAPHLNDVDVSYKDGVLTIKFGEEYGTYVLNRQLPNKQIWLSSPKSGPKRYDYIQGKWVYKRDGKPLYELLNSEIADITKRKVNFENCSYGGTKK